MISWFVTVCVSDFHDLCPRLSQQGSFNESWHNAIWALESARNDGASSWGTKASNRQCQCTVIMTHSCHQWQCSTMSIGNYNHNNQANDTSAVRAPQMTQIYLPWDEHCRRHIITANSIVPKHMTLYHVNDTATSTEVPEMTHSRNQHSATKYQWHQCRQILERTSKRHSAAEVPRSIQCHRISKRGR